ncbi:MAG TPA: hypothetical protein VL426_01625 [Candidatus Binatia bacterium]|jgi:hypothetical protein|nr:hypothetical protein [Candidatus Binatia bacterium]
MFGRKKAQTGLRINEFTVFGAFVAVAVFGLAYGIIAAALGKITVTDDLGEALWQPAPALTPTEYERQAADVLSPFLGQAASMSREDLDGDDTATLQLVEKTQERLLRIAHVPTDHKDAHLRAVLLLDQWKRALAGPGPDREAVLDKTKQLVKDYPWLLE